MDTTINTEGRPNGRRAGLTELPKDLPMLLTVEDAACITGSSPSAMRGMCRSGKLQAAQVGNKWRINRDALLDMFGLKQVG